jgi:thioredoxin 1
MPTFLVFKSSSVVNTIRGANPSALRDAITKAASEAGATGNAESGASFHTKGYTLGSGSQAARPANTGGFSFDLGSLAPAADAGGIADTMVRFMGLYLTTLFSADAYAAAEASPFRVSAATTARGTGRTL